MNKYDRKELPDVEVWSKLKVGDAVYVLELDQPWVNWSGTITRLRGDIIEVEDGAEQTHNVYIGQLEKIEL